MLELNPLIEQAKILRDKHHGNVISYSKKVFIPLTQLCRNFCHYCTFAQPPHRLQQAYLSPDQVLKIAEAGAKAGCHETLFTLGDKPELRYLEAKEELKKLGYESTIAYLHAMCKMVFEQTGLFPHVNPGVMTREELILLREVSISQGIMLESHSERLCLPGQVHFASPDKDPKARLEMIRLAGELKIPFTTGILIGIGETRDERLESLSILKELHDKYGHIQEIIVQNFRAKLGTKMASSPEPNFEDLVWTVAMARSIFGPEMNIQAPPNLSPDSYPALINAGLNDWGGISPVTKDFVNPEAPWPEIEKLRQHTEKMGKTLVERLASYPKYCKEASLWHDAKFVGKILEKTDADGYARTDPWAPGMTLSPVILFPSSSPLKLLDRGGPFSEEEIVSLFRARGGDFSAICQAADQLRKQVSGDTIRYVVNRNINYTNVCYFKCQFCAFSKGKLSENLRGPAYDLAPEEITRRVQEAWDRGATEVCMQGGIHPRYTGETYLEICRIVKRAAPDIHIHAFSPLEVMSGAKTLGLSLTEYLKRLKEAGLSTLPGTAAEILDDEVRSLICPDKINSEEWLNVMETAHQLGIKTTSTIMFGHIDSPKHWARHLLKVRQLQEKTGGFTEFVPLPFVHMQSPIYLKGKSRKGPTFRETLLMHAISRLVLHPVITNIQVSWVKMGIEGAKACLNAGANDLGGTLMNESISRAAGASHGQQMSAKCLDDLINSIERLPEHRTTLYGKVAEERIEKCYSAAPLLPVVQTRCK